MELFWFLFSREKSLLCGSNVEISVQASGMCFDSVWLFNSTELLKLHLGGESKVSVVKKDNVFEAKVTVEVYN